MSIEIFHVEINVIYITVIFEVRNKGKNRMIATIYYSIPHAHRFY